MSTPATSSPPPQHLPWVPAAAFVVVWSSGYIAGPAAVHAAAPFNVLGWRFVLAAVIGALLALTLGRPFRMSRQTLGRVAGVGLVMNALQFGMMYVAFDLGLGATVSSMFHALSPVLTAILAALVLHERLSWVQVAGFVTGVVGVLVVLGADLGHVGGPLAVALGALSVLTLSLGTLGQRWIGGSPDLLWSATIQFAVSAPPLLFIGWVTEGFWPVLDPGKAVVSVLYLAIINSILGLVLLALLVLRGGSGAAASLFFLAPPVTAVLAWLVLGETLGPRQVVGLVITMVGVGAATHSRRRTVAEPSAV
ncbi:DMT family transporter [Nocardioides sp. InS609-2]|uniref:DMT family transporter n=1 Tax=Nocardioides sp. InS609-2 TaxID=2760705 RepID=UPI0020BDD69D|nr:DMT family transporter [Nocardioides sp. InS609-2]